MGKKLNRARAHEKKKEGKIRKKDRPAFHLTPRVGWMNDPNGFSYYGGKYHMFYQYYPYRAQWGPMHWGHAVSDDLLHWEFLPCALAPDKSFDRNGCFSGSAITLDDGRQLLLYTGVHPGKKGDVQEQCIAVGDGVDYRKYKGNPVITTDMLPAGASRVDFRDPKIFRDAAGQFRALVASRPADGSGQLLFFTSKDAVHWTFESVLAENRNRYGKMWECPDYFEADGKEVIIVSPQDMQGQEHDFQPGNHTICLIGHRAEDGRFVEKSVHEVDNGIDFYAAQTVLSPDGRRIMIGWMQNWDTLAIRSPEEAWAGQMSLPREVWVEGGRLHQRPVREVEALRKKPVSYDGIRIGNEEVRLDGVSGRIVDLSLDLSLADCRSFTLRLAEGGGFHTDLVYNGPQKTLTFDRTCSGTRRAVCNTATADAPVDVDGHMRLRLILDRFSAEVFIGNGERVMTVTFYTDQKHDGISFSADGDVSMNVRKYDLAH